MIPRGVRVWIYRLCAIVASASIVFGVTWISWGIWGRTAPAPSSRDNPTEGPARESPTFFHGNPDWNLDPPAIPVNSDGHEDPYDGLFYDGLWPQETPVDPDGHEDPYDSLFYDGVWPRPDTPSRPEPGWSDF